MFIPTNERYHRVVLGLVMVAQVVSPMVVFSIGALAPLLRESLHLSREQVGYLAALFFASTALVSIPAGLAADKLGVRSLLIPAQVVGGLPLAVTPFLQTYHELLLVMFLVGLAWGTVTILTTKAIIEWFPPHRRATAIGLKQAGMPFSGGLAAAVVPWIGLMGRLAPCPRRLRRLDPCLSRMSLVVLPRRPAACSSQNRAAPASLGGALPVP